MLFKSHASSAKAALSLKKDSIFKLLLVMTILLGWLFGVGAAAIMGLENIYSSWKLEQKSHISVYINEADPQLASKIGEKLVKLPNVAEFKILNDDEILELIAPYFNDSTELPLPLVMDVTINGAIDRTAFDKIVNDASQNAVIDDARELLTDIANGVRFVQLLVVALAVIMFSIMAMIVSLTVRAGMASKQSTLAILQYIGATDSFVTTLISRQVMVRSLLGWMVAGSMSVLSVFAFATLWPSLIDFINLKVWLAAGIVPLILPLTAIIVAYLTAGRVVKKPA